MLEYRLGDVIGSGGYSLVFRAVEASSKKTVALKKSRVSLKVKRTVLRHESRILQFLQGHPAIPTLYEYGRLPHFEYLTMELLGRNVKELSASPAQSSVKTVVRVAEQMLSALNYVHELGIVHRDIKPENLVVSLTDPSKILLIDFGISRFFRTGVPTQYNPLKKSRYIVGTLHWASLNAHDGIDLGPRDDLESLAFVLFFLLRGDLPWRSGSNTESIQRSMSRIRAFKAACTGAALATNFPPEFGDLLDYTRALRFDHIPDYDHLAARFQSLAQRLGCESHQPLEWSPSDVIQPVVSPSAPKESLDEGEEDEEDEDDDGGDESFSNSYFALDIALWDIQGNRDPDLTFPEEQARMLDVEISKVDKWRS